MRRMLKFFYLMESCKNILLKMIIIIISSVIFKCGMQNLDCICYIFFCLLATSSFSKRCYLLKLNFIQFIWCSILFESQVQYDRLMNNCCYLLITLSCDFFFYFSLLFLIFSFSQYYCFHDYCTCSFYCAKFFAKHKINILLHEIITKKE